MHKYVCLLLSAILFSFYTQAAVGDTTIVQAHDTTWLSYNGNYDTTVLFPASSSSKTYRKIYMTFTLGKYHCPGSPTYCGDWDYTVLTYLMTKTGDTLELGRLISPYANASNPRTPWTWKQHYVFDVTDFYPLLKDSGTVRVSYSGWTGGFTANVKFTFIEGTPDRNVIGVKRLWHGSPNYGTTKGIDSSFLPVSLTAPASAVSAEMKVLITGHGSDANGCCEFASHYYNVMLNSTSIDNTNIWRSDCGSNELYPQTGTWIYERGNWCPGALVRAHYHDLPGITGGSNYNVALHFEPYTIASPSGTYTTEAQVFYYGVINKTTDASMDGIISPTNDENHFRENPFSGGPVVHVKNTGNNTINSIKIQYGVTGYYMPTYIWNGSLAPLHDTDITLPPLWELRSLSGMVGTFNFVATILEVNGAADNDPSNNSMNTAFTTVPIWPFKIAIQLKTNGSKMPSGYSETSWMIYDVNNPNTPVAMRINNAINTTYNDTVTLAGAYKLVVADSGCDGISWWNYANYSPNPGIGSFKVTTTTSAFAKPLTGYFSGDFGCGFVQYFTAGWTNAGVANMNEQGIRIDTYPSPAQNKITINITGMQNVNGNLQIIDALGKVAMMVPCNKASLVVDIAGLQNGLYTVLFTDNDNQRLQTRVVVAK